WYGTFSRRRTAAPAKLSDQGNVRRGGRFQYRPRSGPRCASNWDTGGRGQDEARREGDLPYPAPRAGPRARRRLDEVRAGVRARSEGTRSKSSLELSAHLRRRRFCGGEVGEVGGEQRRVGRPVRGLNGPAWGEEDD